MYQRLKDWFKLIKGVNHKVVEVTDTQNDFFEKILFFVKSEHADTSEGKLREEAKIIVNAAGEPPLTRKRHNRLRNALKYFFAVVAGAVTAFAVALLLK